MNDSLRHSILVTLESGATMSLAVSSDQLLSILAYVVDGSDFANPSSNRRAYDGLAQEGISFEDAIGVLPARLAGRPRALLEILRDADGPVRDDDIRSQLGIGADNRKLAGVVSGLSKQANKLGINFERIVTRSTVVDESDAKNHYYALTEEARLVMDPPE